eukprot:TRINITY_DN1309_c0_g1_i5.p2 TRINITY_DN1309_c0_g1~~TRINITY_DN1309_c0_g1_i5.p2  ORF type:complete len:275 (+),score=48.51 TRINITY_DN1309_c0_g1_i5:96-920(+)
MSQLLSAAGALSGGESVQKGSGSLLLYVRCGDQLHPVDVDGDATVHQLYAALPDVCKGCRLSFQGQLLADTDAAIADTSLSAEAVLDALFAPALGWTNKLRPCDGGGDPSHCRPAYWDFGCPIDGDQAQERFQVATKCSGSGWSCNTYALPPFAEHGVVCASVQLRGTVARDARDSADAVGLTGEQRNYLWSGGCVTLCLSDGSVNTTGSVRGQLRIPEQGDVIHFRLDTRESKFKVWIGADEETCVEGTTEHAVKLPIYVAVEARRLGWSFQL